jgi:hypothetical protein
MVRGGSIGLSIVDFAAVFVKRDRRIPKRRERMKRNKMMTMENDEIKTQEWEKRDRRLLRKYTQKRKNNGWKGAKRVRNSSYGFNGVHCLV